MSYKHERKKRIFCDAGHNLRNIRIHRMMSPPIQSYIPFRYCPHSSNNILALLGEPLSDREARKFE